MIDFFSKDEEARIVQTISEAERQTSGEIRVHMERDYEGTILGAASRTFFALGMDRTKDRNGVLIFISPPRHDFAIFGDRGINAVVPPHFWEEVRNVMQQNFRQGMFAEGVCQGVKMAGEKLQAFFPWTDGDKNELSDEISYGK
ncbi:MAG: TPM domain-containing protein [Saprospiraceae bacterium]|nr:TPM domain-containing protein [Saprospiraceae bacterium]